MVWAVCSICAEFLNLGFLCGDGFLRTFFEVYTVLLSDVLLEGTKGACSNANALAIDVGNLQVHVLAAACGDVGVAAGVAKTGTLSGQLADAGHRVDGLS